MRLKYMRVIQSHSGADMPLEFRKKAFSYQMGVRTVFILRAEKPKTEYEIRGVFKYAGLKVPVRPKRFQVFVRCEDGCGSVEGGSQQSPISLYNLSPLDIIDLMRMKDAAEYSGLHPNMLRKYIDKGVIRGVRIVMEYDDGLARFGLGYLKEISITGLSSSW